MERPDIYVLSRLLERLWRENGPMMKTRLQVASNVNYDVLTKYLEWMSAKRFVTYEAADGHDLVRLTPSGKNAYLKILQVVGEVLAVPAFSSRDLT
jgi:predicted transcriptional regulator